MTSGLLLKLSQVHLMPFDNNNLTIDLSPKPAAKCNIVNLYLVYSIISTSGSSSRIAKHY